MRIPRLILPLGALLLVVAAAPADARRVGIRVQGVAYCTRTTVNVRLTNGAVVRRTHVRPGRLVRGVNRSSKDLLLFVRINASWRTVQLGQTLRVRADGPDGEQWTWRFQLSNRRPLADPTPYQACLKLRTRTGKFLRRMQARPGDWRFTTRITNGSLVRSSGTRTIVAK